ncbi:hypothetical protein [Candidatus Syntrophocurvum alkaliphilum]
MKLRCMLSKVKYQAQLLWLLVVFMVMVLLVIRLPKKLKILKLKEALY